MSVRSELSVRAMIMRRCLSNVAVRYSWLTDVGRTAPLRCVQVNQTVRSDLIFQRVRPPY
jgi:hypothetical protein